MFTQLYMQNALLTGTIVAVLAGLVGFFVVLRGVSVAAHALAQIGFARAAGAVLIGLDPLWGLALFALGGGIGMSVPGARDHDRDVATALILVAALGVGALFLTLNTSYATAAFTLLFGNIAGIDRVQVWETLALTLACLVGLGILFHPLLASAPTTAALHFVRHGDLVVAVPERMCGPVIAALGLRMLPASLDLPPWPSFRPGTTGTTGIGPTPGCAARCAKSSR